MMAADNLGTPRSYTTIKNLFPNHLHNPYLASYGSLARFKDVQRLHSVGDNTVIGAGGDMSDFQYIQTLLNELTIEEYTAQDGHSLGPAEIHEYLSQVMYARRSKINPLWNSLLVGGVKDGKKCVHSGLDGFIFPSLISHPGSLPTLTFWAPPIPHPPLPLATEHISPNPSYEQQSKAVRTN
jgi:hypothetical protein